MSKEEVADELHRLFDDVEELLRRVSDLGDEEIAGLRQRVESSIANVRSAAGTVAQDADNYVRGNPWMAVGIAAAAGLLLGGLLSRR